VDAGLADRQAPPLGWWGRADRHHLPFDVAASDATGDDGSIDVAGGDASDGALPDAGAKGETDAATHEKRGAESCRRDIGRCMVSSVIMTRAVPVLLVGLR
jgi:hypothetical protein